MTPLACRGHAGSHRHYDTYDRFVVAMGLEDQKPRLKTPVFVTRHHGALELAEFIKHTYNTETGILNPMDAEALRTGRLLQDVDPLTNALPLRTTLFVQHADLNADLWHHEDRIKAYPILQP